MRTGHVRPMLVIVLLALLAPQLRAADGPGIEIGASLASGTIGLGKNEGNSFGVPSSTFSTLTPGVYASVFLNDRLSVDPQLGLLWIGDHGDSAHALNLGGQVNLFLQSANSSAPYVFASGGFIDVSGSSRTPRYVSGGAGYRFRTGEQLALRFDGRFSHYTEGGGNMLTFTLSIGGLF